MTVERLTDEDIRTLRTLIDAQRSFDRLYEDGASTGLGIDYAGDGAIWPLSKIQAGLKTRAEGVELLETDDQRHVLRAREPETEMTFIAVLDHVSGRPNDIKAITFACFIANVAGMTEDWVEELNEALPVGLAELNEHGQLGIFAAPKVQGDFNKDLFDLQISLFYQVLHTVYNRIVLLMRAGGQTMSAADTVRDFLSHQSDGGAKLYNYLDQPPAEARPSKAHEQTVASFGGMMGGRRTCPDCGGRGRRRFRQCGTCGGSGYIG